MTISKKHLNHAMRIICNEHKPNECLYITEELLYKNGFPQKVDASRTIEVLIAMGYLDLDTSIDNYSFATISNKGLMYHEINNIERSEKRKELIKYIITTSIAAAALIFNVINVICQ